ncbi:thermonuclease family protein [Echinimonas agarilytica]|uniref:Thermonuclease family protein n=1 Tax=Echinimonas agarilytica TaxID=1215918 RepID=A0AA41W419_9GAMM|nr:thermonuclease family protein [Echinimonas agarilytica]MCM2678320.1 thermonuclease family protein [Echinimonas agarilytica]
MAPFLYPDFVIQSIKVDETRMQTCIRVFCLLCLIGPFANTYAATPHMLACPPITQRTNLTIQQIHDGDTVTLSNGERIRFLGINAPEINHDVPARSQPFALEAREALTRLLDEQSISVGTDGRGVDRFGRTLGHVVNFQGVNVNQQLLLEGMARLMVIDDFDMWRCYAMAEWLAREQRIGIWSHNKAHPVMAQSIRKAHRKWIEVSGKVTHFERSSSNLWWVLDDTVWVGVELAQADSVNLPSDISVIGEQWIVRGTVHKSYGKFRMRLKHPSQVLRVEEWQHWATQVGPVVN